MAWDAREALMYSHGSRFGPQGRRCKAPRCCVYAGNRSTISGSQGQSEAAASLTIRYRLRVKIGAPDTR